MEEGQKERQIQKKNNQSSPMRKREEQNRVNEEKDRNNQRQVGEGVIKKVRTQGGN